ncbi:MAG: DUF928 domain-containing protein [Mojavia pulchra JT2-VF2]|jgi:hypothetical protein|uniref:DUF928 domain-containing protein n=1 Tax=Mojavia pulchra JT2-VF2 TaxID=287848 RepID=A0A951UEU3_9NOST|nr:DUF928 domain-containing protein [Mojavia pulchra JT2-VF2]
MVEKTLNTRTFTILCLTSVLTFSWACFQQVLANSEQRAREGLPGRRIGGGTRGECSSNAGRLMALVPENNLGLTKQAYPNFLFYLPRTATPRTVEFVLQDDKRRSVYEANFTTPSSGGVINFSLPDSAFLPPLTIGKKYNWYLSMICDPENRATDVVVHGWIKRVETDSVLTKKLQQTSPLGRVTLYAQAGLWQDALGTLAELKYTRPNDSQLAASWIQLLKSEKLDAIAQEPLLKIKIPTSH